MIATAKSQAILIAWLKLRKPLIAAGNKTVMFFCYRISSSQPTQWFLFKPPFNYLPPSVPAKLLHHQVHEWFWLGLNDKGSKYAVMVILMIEKLVNSLSSSHMKPELEFLSRFVMPTKWREVVQNGVGVNEWGERRENVGEFCAVAGYWGGHGQWEELNQKAVPLLFIELWCGF